MSNKRNNERLQELEKQNAELAESLLGSRKARTKLEDALRECMDHSDDIARALMRYENNILCRLCRFIAMRKKPTDILLDRWESTKA